jgi:hypothetical protein
MATMVPNRRSTFGINCVRCKDELIAREKSECRYGTRIRHLWYCSNCENLLRVTGIYPSRGDDVGRYLPVNSCRVNGSWRPSGPSGIFVTLHGVL